MVDLSTHLPRVLLADAALQALCAVLGADEGQVRLVGGAVRDGLLGLAVNDVDLATPLLPAEVQARVGKAGFKAIPTGIDHGTITAVVDSRPFEVTTLRRDVATDGRRATVAFSSDWAEDAARRDFTINALYADPVTGEIFDYHGGLADLATGHVRFIGDAAARIAEDHLRILRYFRFLARYGDAGNPDAETLRIITANAPSLRTLSRERIADELRKILALLDPLLTVNQMLAAQIFANIIPEVGGSTVLDDVIAAEKAQGISPSSMRRLAALLGNDPAAAHDVGARLRLSNAERSHLGSITTPNADAANPAALAYALGVDAAMDYILLRGGDARSLIGWQRPIFPLKGGAIVARGVAKGPEVARILQAIERQWIDAGFPGDAAVQALLDRAISDQS
jgi:poly(A) polymerase